MASVWHRGLLAWSCGLGVAVACAPAAGPEPSQTPAGPTTASEATSPETRPTRAAPSRPEPLRFDWPSACTVPVSVSEGTSGHRVVATHVLRHEPSPRNPGHSVLRLVDLKHVSLGGLTAKDGREVAASIKRYDGNLQYYPPIELDAEGRYVDFEPTHSGAESWAMKRRDNWEARVELWIDIALDVGETSTTDGEFRRTRFGPLPSSVLVERLPDREGRARLRRTETVRTDVPAETIRANLLATGEREDLGDQMVQLWTSEAYEFELVRTHEVELDRATLQPYRVEIATRERWSLDDRASDREVVREEVWDWANATDCP